MRESGVVKKEGNSDLAEADGIFHLKLISGERFPAVRSTIYWPNARITSEPFHGKGGPEY